MVNQNVTWPIHEINTLFVFILQPELPPELLTAPQGCVALHEEVMYYCSYGIHSVLCHSVQCQIHISLAEMELVSGVCWESGKIASCFHQL